MSKVAAQTGRNGLDTVPCPLCSSQDPTTHWASENSYNCVRCSNCGLLFVNPRPPVQQIDKSVQLGNHDLGEGTLNVSGRRLWGKPRSFEKIVRQMFGDVIKQNEPISWLDVGAGYGEFMEALARVVPPGSTIEGLEPMLSKANRSISRGLSVRQGYIKDIDSQYDYVSLMDVFSHIPDFKTFLEETKSILRAGGEILIKTGNAADIGERSNFPGPLTLPDHLVFAGESQMIRFLKEAGFQVVSIRRERVDGVIHSLKNAVKWILRKPVFLSLPYTSPSRVLFIRAKLVAK
jgi:SAM-dependent methyltransferase